MREKQVIAGSVLGNYHNQPQPNQKYFESQIFEKFQFEFKPEKVIWVEYESFKIGITMILLLLNYYGSCIQETSRCLNLFQTKC